ncbi:MAG: antibiotic biosynthesis monooxygenase [Pseudomonadota bacterium]
MFGFPNPFQPFAPAAAPSDDRSTSGKGTGRIVLINTFVVPTHMEDAFLQWWRMSRMFFSAQPGFVSAKLHRSLDQKERYRFINVAEWDSPQAYRDALGSIWSAVPRPTIPGMEWHPALYEVIEE